jgi:hypothetical protein
MRSSSGRCSTLLCGPISTRLKPANIASGPRRGFCLSQSVSLRNRSSTGASEDESLTPDDLTKLERPPDGPALALRLGLERPRLCL